MKRKILLFLLLGFTLLFASHLVVRDGDALLLINGYKVKVHKDQNLTLEPGTMVCYEGGSGKVIIDGKKELSHQTKECWQIPVDDAGAIRKLLSSTHKSIQIITGIQEVSTDESESNTTLRSATTIGPESAGKKPIILSPEKRELILYNSTYGPLPVTMSIQKPDGSVVKRLVNEDNIHTLFRVPASYLENDSKITVTNAFGEKLLDKRVEIQASAPKKNKQHAKIYYEKKKYTIVDILYGTDRKKNPKKSGFEEYYTGQRGTLQYGVARVSVPKIHRFGAMERPGKHLLIFDEKEDPEKHVMITSLERIDQKKFIHLLKTKLTNVKENDILIFIHGFNVSFASAVRRTAQVIYDLKFKGVPMAYSWPSKGEVSEYMYDEASVQYTTPHLVAFLKNVIENRGKANIHIIGHSMGTRALTNALKEISFLYPGKHPFKNIILAAPDIDRDVFRESLFPYIIKTTDKITLYASSSDKALQLSETLHSGSRIGEGGDEVFVYPGLDTIDATGVDTSLLGHSYFAQKKILVTDLKEVIVKSLPPQKRRSLKEIIREQLAYWRFILQQ